MIFLDVMTAGKKVTVGPGRGGKQIHTSVV